MDITVDVAADGDRPLPSTLALGIANPFRDATRLDYAMPQRGRARVAVYDVRGHRVRLLVDAVQDAGRYEATWNACDDRGARVASGVYIVRYEAGASVLTRRTVLLR